MHRRNKEDKKGRSDSGKSSEPNFQELSRAHGAEHYASKRKSHGARRVLKVVLITVLAVAASGTIAVAAYIHSINSKLSSGVDSSLRDTLTETSYNEPFYMLLLGTDKDAEREEGEYGTSDSAYRSDTIILARIDPSNKKVTLISIPRDTMVDMGENGTQKINAAYSIGGAAYVTQVVSKLAGVSISHYAEVDMDGFASIVDKVGGVTVNLPVAVSDPNYTGLDLPAGEQTLDGTTAALLCRARHAYDNYGGGDFYRAANQRMVIGAIIKKVLASDPVTMASTVSTMASYVTTDMDVASIVSLATQFSGMDVDNDVYSGQLPTTSEYVNNTWYEVVNTSEWEQIMKRVDAGETPYTDSSQDTTDGVAGSVGKSYDSSSSDGSDSSSSSSTSETYSGTVVVLNAGAADGSATSASNSLASMGFTATPKTGGYVTQTSTVIYNGSDAQTKAQAAADKLGITSVQANDGSYSTGADIIVVLGSGWSSSGPGSASSGSGSSGSGSGSGSGYGSYSSGN